MEHKTFPAIVTKAQDDEGIVETIFAVFGNIDDGDDVIHPGAFAKTFSERGTKVRILDQHRTDSIMAALGKPLELRELRRDDLPLDLLRQAPEAMGGAYAKVQFLMKTPEGQGAFERLKSGAVSEWSFGYDAINSDVSKAERNGEEIMVRNLRALKLYEISPVLWGMNPATMTASAKVAPSEGKPYRAVREGDRWAVYKLDEDGKPTGSPLGTHDTEGEAQAQVRALYANEEDGKGEDAMDDEKAITSEDRSVLTSEIRKLTMTNLVATHRRLHQYAARNAPLEGFSRSDMNWFHSTVEKELRHRAQEDGRDAPEATPLEWGSGKADEADFDLEDDEEKCLPGRVAVIRRRALGKAVVLEWAEPIWDAAQEKDVEAFNNYMSQLSDSQAGPDAKRTPPTCEDTEAGPDAESEPPTSEDVLQLIQLEELEMSLMEV